MIIIKIRGAMAVGKTTLTEQLHHMLTQQGTTWRERLAWWLLKKSSWNKFQLRARDVHILEDHQLSPAAVDNLRRHGVKIIIEDGKI